MSRFVVTGILLIVASFTLSGCSARSYAPTFQDVSAPAGRALQPNNNPKSIEYVSVRADQSSNIYSCHNGDCFSCKTVGSGGVTGMGGSPSPPSHFTASGSIYVAVYGGGQVLGLDSSCTTKRTLADPGYRPFDVAVATDGTVGVTNYSSTSSGAGNIVFYAPGSKKPTRVATGLFLFYTFGAFDKNGNFYNDGVTSSGGSGIGVVKAKSKIDHAAGISGVKSPAGIQIAQNGTINILDEAGPTIEVYSGTKHTKTVTLSSATLPVSFTFNANDTRVWVTDYSSGTLDEYAYPSGGTPLKMIPGFTNAFGVAMLPAATP